MPARLRLFGFPLVLLAILVQLSGLPFPASASSSVILSGFPTLRQQHSLTCESAATSMATRGIISESALMDAMPRNPNPNLGFRGNPDGTQGTSLVAYGVYAPPLQRALTHFGYRSDVLLYSSRTQLESYVNRGWPVVTWVTYALQNATPRLAEANGVLFFLVPHEHAVLLVGYDTRTVYVNDPWTGTMVRYYWRDFLRSWGHFGNMALAVDPCALPAPVSTVAVRRVSTDSVTWAWSAAANASQYLVTIVKKGTTDKQILQVTQAARTVTISTPRAGGQYEFTVRALSPCGDGSRPLRYLVQLPEILPTPTPPPPATLGTVTPTATIGPSPDGTTTPTVTPTP